jgi:hypothetical protein
MTLSLPGNGCSKRDIAFLGSVFAYTPQSHFAPEWSRQRMDTNKNAPSGVRDTGTVQDRGTAL